MKKTRILIFILTALLCFGNTAFAESRPSYGGSSGGGYGGGSGSAVVIPVSENVNITVDYSDHTVIVDVTSAPAYKFRNISLQVLNPGTTALDNLYEDGVLNWSDQGKTDKNGSYTFKFKMNGESGYYKVYVGIDGQDKTHYNGFDYYSPTEVTATEKNIAEYVKQNNISGIELIISNNAQMLQIDISAFEEMSDDSQKLVCKGIVAAKPDKLSNFKAAFEESVEIQQINLIADKDEYYSEVTEFIGNEYEAVNKLFKTLDESVQAKILDDMMSENFITKKDIANYYTDSILLTKVNAISVWGEMESFLKDVQNIIGIDFSDYDKLKDKSEAIKEMLDDTFTSAEDIKKSFNKAVENAKENEEDSGSSSGGNGGGGGGGGSYKTATSVVTPVPDVNSIPASTNEVFTDLGDAQWAKESILELCKKNIISGYENKTFRPNNNVTRAEFLKMTMMLFDIKASNDIENKFEDVNKTDWYYDYVYAALSNGIVSGVSEFKFDPNGLITRQDMAVILYRAANFAGKTYASGEINFSDKNNISDYASEAVSAFSKAGIINGYNNMFNPAKTATRAEAAQILYNILTK